MIVKVPITVEQIVDLKDYKICVDTSIVCISRYHGHETPYIIEPSNTVDRTLDAVTSMCAAHAVNYKIDLATT